MPIKTCFKCEEDKPLEAFYGHPRMKDGRLNKCKECAKEDVRTNRAKRRSQYSAYDRQRFQKPERKVQAVQYQIRRRQKYPEKVKARQAVSNAIRDGRLIRGCCEVCGVDRAQAHHADYSKPFEVQWLCFKHHREIAHGQVVISTV